MRFWWFSLFAVILLTSGANTAFAESFAPKTNNRVIALDVRTGKQLWEHTPTTKLSSAHFEVTATSLVVYPHYDGTKRDNPITLNPATGEPTAAHKRNPAKILARSAVFWPLPPVVLDNTWRLHDFSPGNSKKLNFVNPRGKNVWSIDAPGYAHQVKGYKNLVFWAYSYLSDEGVLYAHSAGKQTPSWTLDLNTIVPNGKLTRMIFQTIDDVLYINSSEHIFAVEPLSGKLLWHLNLSKKLNLPFRPGFFDGALDLAVFSKSKDGVLIVAFERRVLAIDLHTKQILWHLEPDTFPHCPFPVVHGGKVFLSSGAKRTLTTVK